MRKFIISTGIGLALAAGLWTLSGTAQPVGPPNEIWCNRVNNATNAAGTGLAISAVAGQLISFCGFNATAGVATGSFQVIAGQGAACGTQTVTLTPVIPLPINGNVVDHTSNAWVTLPSLSNLCIVTTGGPVAYNLYYAQF